jgi:hypothetical protein
LTVPDRIAPVGFFVAVSQQSASADRKENNPGLATLRENPFQTDII